MRNDQKLRHMRLAGILRTVVVVFVVITSAYANSVRTQSSKVKTVHASSDEPLWRVDLQSVGFPANELALQSRRNPDVFRTIDFLSEDVVAATFITRVLEPDLPKRDDPNRPRRDLLHAIFLDAATGKVLKTIDWPTDDAGAGIFPRYDGSFLFFSKEHIVLYSPEWTPVKEFVLPQLQTPHIALTGIAQSPSGRALELRIEDERSVVCVRIQTFTLEGVQEPCITRLGRFSISDDAIAQADLEDLIKLLEARKSANGPVTIPSNSSAPFKGKIMIREMGADARLLCDPNHISSCSNPQFIDNQSVVVYGMTGLSLLTRRGESNDQHFEKVFTSDHTWVDIGGGMIRPSSNGQRFAAVFDEPPGNINPSAGRFSLILTPDHIDVYDVPEGGYVFTLKNKKKQFKEIYGLALAPSGEKLAVDSGGVIQMYALPPRKDN